MFKQILHLKIAQNLGSTGIRLRMGSYKRFHTTQVRYLLLNNIGFPPNLFTQRKAMAERAPQFPKGISPESHERYMTWEAFSSHGVELINRISAVEKV